jgi:hypothetical protein
MKILKWSLIILAVLIVALLGYLAYLGVFSALKVTEQKLGPYTLAYAEYMGPYSGSGPILTRVNNSLKQDGVECTKGFGIYFDDPKQVAADKLRSKLGCIIEAKDLAKFGKVSRKYKIMKWPARDCLVTEFPIRSDLSYMIGPMKAYPELNKALKAKGYKMSTVMELYDMPAKKILYIMVIAK